MKPSRLDLAETMASLQLVEFIATAIAPRTNRADSFASVFRFGSGVHSRQ
jgi:hypothetical protein